ncbi:Insulin/IGF/Relaxin family protein [Dictyocaulus viviparus]|uniref:Insulin/IGF/Relaxin family protein n=1 Tax=Dictyocaulus viviparus TaxID=29172 RepID=A0A0D8YDC4_DICVI|nr:Insulin/IGF/Relaxin family protein [Dictyocaulus viviparus]
MSSRRWSLLIYLLMIFATVSLTSPQARYCGRKLTKVLLDICGSVNSPTADQLETGRRLAGDLGIVHHCCRRPCDVTFMRRYCAKSGVDSLIAVAFSKRLGPLSNPLRDNIKGRKYGRESFFLCSYVRTGHFESHY